MIKEIDTTKSTLIDGEELHKSKLVSLKEHQDERGSFTEIFQKHWGTVIDPVQWSFVKSEKSVFRGLHFHKRHDEYFCLIKGRCILGLKDMNQASPTYNKFALYHLSDQDLKALIFPRGVLHGWYFEEESMHIQSVSESYLDYGKEDNFGCKWDAPDLDIPWPFDVVEMSDRAEGFKNVKDLPYFSEEL